LSHLLNAALQYAPPGRVVEIREYGRGNVNDTYLVTMASPHPEFPPTGVRESHFILQRLNPKVFRRPDLVMGNLRLLSEHVARRLEHAAGSARRRFELPRALPARDGGDYWLAPDGSCWRALSFIEGTRSFDTIQDLNHAREVGRALGSFHHLVSDLPPEKLADTLEGFHITPGYLRHYDEVLAARRAETSPEVAYALRFVEARRAWAGVLEEARDRGELRQRVIHGDPKVNNVMLDAATAQAVALVDLDTVKPGLAHYDLGDCLRSGCNPLGEEPGRWEQVNFDLDICRAIVAGYLSMARNFLTANDYVYLYDAVRLIAFELGLRFFTDYLEGNVYFKVRRREQNLARALVQFRLTESIESQEKAIRTIIREGAARPQG
jgi:Ser/Thr protein kinase RdoA (MazF antagonist)